MVYFKTLRQPQSYSRFKRLIEGCDIMNIQIVTSQNDHIGVRIALVK